MIQVVETLLVSSTVPFSSILNPQKLIDGQDYKTNIHATPVAIFGVSVTPSVILPFYNRVQSV